MKKATLITWLAGLPDDSSILDRVDEFRRGTAQIEPEERRLSLKQTSTAVGKHVTWLSKIGVPEACGERLGGRRSYKLSRVLDYLKSDHCRARIAELHVKRQAREKGKENKQ